MRPKPTKSPTKFTTSNSKDAATKRIPSEGRAPENKRFKATTQNINIYNIIHNVNKQQSFYNEIPSGDAFPMGKTYDNPILNAKNLLKSKHDLRLDKELQAYRIEVELRFNGSEANRNYAFPRSVPGAQEEELATKKSSAAAFFSGTTIPASIYDKKGLDEISVSLHETRNGANKSRHHSRNETTTTYTQKRAINDDFYKQVQVLLRPNYESSEKKTHMSEIPNAGKGSKLTLYGTQRVNYKSTSPANKNGIGAAGVNSNSKKVREVRQAYMNGTMYLQGANKVRYHDKALCESVNLGAKNSHHEALPSLTSLDSIRVSKQKSHTRTKTMENTSMDAKALKLKKIVHLKQTKEGVDKSRTHMQGVSDYFRSLINQKAKNAAHTRALSRVTNTQKRHRSNFSGVFSSSTLNMTNFCGAVKGIVPAVKR